MKVEDDSLSNAFQYAYIEARQWKNTADIIKNMSHLDMQYCVILSYVCELCLKSILMYNHINITDPKKKAGHSLNKLFHLLPDELKEKLEQDIHFTPIIYTDLITEKSYNYTHFNDILNYISNTFVNLRYNYERFCNGKAIVLPTPQIEHLSNILYSTTYELIKIALKEGIDDA